MIPKVGDMVTLRNGPFIVGKLVQILTPPDHEGCQPQGIVHCTNGLRTYDIAPLSRWRIVGEAPEPPIIVGDIVVHISKRIMGKVWQIHNDPPRPNTIPQVIVIDHAGYRMAAPLDQWALYYRLEGTSPTQLLLDESVGGEPSVH